MSRPTEKRAATAVLEGMKVESQNKNIVEQKKERGRWYKMHKNILENA